MEALWSAPLTVDILRMELTKAAGLSEGRTPLQCLLMTQSGHERLRIAAVQPDPEPHFVGRKLLM